MKSRILMTAAALLIAASSSAHAVGVSGSFGFSGLNATQNGANLSSSTLFTFTQYLVTSAGTGDFSGVVSGTFFNGPNPPSVTGQLDISSPAAMSGFTISNANFGTFVANNTAFNQIVAQASNFLIVQLVGTFTPTGNLGTFDPTPADVLVSINQSGTSLSAGFTLTAPTNVPEPSTYALGVLSTVVLGGVARRKRMAKASV